MVAALSAGSMFFSMVSPAFAATTIEVSGNGASSENEVEVRNNNNTVVTQTNNAIVTNTVSSSASTGGNDANQNTGGDVLVSTGDAATATKISNMLNSNKASVDCCENQGADVLISGNGAYSKNEVELGEKKYRKEESTDLRIDQVNNAVVSNAVEAKASTGKNDANQNTGGDVLVHTGDAATLVEVSTTANSNWAKVGGRGEESTLSARILGNGANSENEIELNLDKDIILLQNNVANVINDVEAGASTGKNDANQNTGGDVLVSTGDADTSVEIDNMVNFNWADVDCGCVTDLMAKIAGNGYDSENEIEFKNDSELLVPQTNAALLANVLDELAKTGYNDVEQNTGDPGSDPAVLTGDAYSFTGVENTGNLNSFGGEMHPEWPEFDFDFNFSLSWNDLGHFLFWI
jgi:hypothetical protein